MAAVVCVLALRGPEREGRVNENRRGRVFLGWNGEGEKQQEAFGAALPRSVPSLTWNPWLTCKSKCGCRLLGKEPCVSRCQLWSQVAVPLSSGTQGLAKV